MKIKWIRGSDNIDFSTPQVYFGLGVRGSGKSSLLEHVGEGFLDKGHALFDLFGSRDGEGLAWLRSPYAKDRKILLLKGENVDVNCSYETKTATSLTLADLAKYDMIISASPLYLSIDQEFLCSAHCIDTLYRRLHYSRLIYCIAREASNLFYSRLRVSVNQLAAKAETAYLLRESRHLGVCMGLDSLRQTSIDIDIRSVTDFLFLKSQGVSGLSRDLRFLYSFINAAFLRDMKANRFVILTRRGAIGYGVFPEIPWHKTANEDILSNLGFKIEYGEQRLEESVLKGTYKTVSDLEHVKIIELYVKENFSMIQVGEKLERSSRTVQVHINSHNSSIERSGFCGPCKRAESEYASRTAGRGLS